MTNFKYVRAFAFLLALTSIPAEAEAGHKRYILRGPNLQRIKTRALQLKGFHQQDLEFSQAAVMDLDPEAAASLKRELGRQYEVEEDARVTILGRLNILKVSGSALRQPAQITPWGINAVAAPPAWQYAKGAGVKVCVVDTGVQVDHPDLKANIVGGKNFVAYRGKVDPTRYGDDNGHGTHVSGTIAALNNSIGVVGVAPQAKIYAVKVLDKSGSGYMSAVADGIRACVAAGAKVISMSLGSSSDSSLVRDAVTFAASKGVILVAAAGNESGTVSYPAKYPEVWAISAMDSKYKFAYFSNFGPEVDFIAPGVNVYSTTKGSSYASYSGTSMAAPHAAGIVALMLSSGSNRIGALDLGLPLDQQGSGLVNAPSTVGH